MDITRAPELAFLAMYAEDMHRDSDTGSKLLAPDIDQRLAADHDVKALLVANDAIFSLNKRMQIGPEPLYYGYVAQSKADPSTWIVGVRGTAGIAEWVIDGEFLPQDCPRGAGLKVEHGFWSIYETMELCECDGTTVINSDAAAGIGKLVGPGCKVTIVGHSLGSALATYLAYDITKHLQDRVSACLFASPRTGNKAWVDAVHTALQDRYLVINYLLDVVPNLPAASPDYCTAQNVEVLRPSTADAGIKVEVRSNHHVLCYAAMLSYATYQVHYASLRNVDASERACVLGDKTTVPFEAKILEKVVDAGHAVGLDGGEALRSMVKLRIEPKSGAAAPFT